MSNVMTSIRNVFKFHKLKILLFFGLFIVFGIIIFPYNDLGDLVTAKVSQATQNAVYLQFTDLTPSFFPSVGLEFENVSIDTPVIQDIKANSLTVRPSILSLLAFKPGLSVNAEGFFKGTADISGSIPGFSPEASMKPKISGELKGLDLSEVTKSLKLPIDLGGKLGFETDSLSLDLTNFELTNGDVQANIKDAKLGSMNLNTPLGPLPLPAMAFSVIDLQAEAKNGTVKVAKLTLGKSGDELSGSAKGQFDIKNQPYGPPLGSYDFSIELEVLAAFESKMGILWSTLEGFIETYKRASPAGKKNFAFRISGQGVMAPPKISPYQ